MSNQKLFDYFANQHGLVLIDSELHEITLEVCKSIGIDSLEPAEWVKEKDLLQVRFDDYSVELDNTKEELKQLQSENDKLRAELETLKGFNEVVMSERNWQLEVIEPMLNDQIESLKDELAKLKGE